MNYNIEDNITNKFFHGIGIGIGTGIDHFFSYTAATDKG